MKSKGFAEAECVTTFCNKNIVNANDNDEREGIIFYGYAIVNANISRQPEAVIAMMVTGRDRIVNNNGIRLVTHSVN